MNSEPTPAILAAIEAAVKGREGSRRGDETTFLCPAHPDRHPSASWNSEKFVWTCRACGDGGGWRDLARRLDIDTKVPRAVAPKGESRYFIMQGNSVAAVKVRVDDGEGNKKIHWEDADGNVGLPEGVSPADYLYGMALPGQPVFLTEGERAAECLYNAGYGAVGTVGGANNAPTDVALSILKDYRVNIWPDNDEPGRKAALEIANRLWALGIQDLYMVEWPDAPDKGDAADYVAAYGSDLEHLKMRRWRPPEPTRFTAAELMSVKLPEPRYAVNGLLAEGLNVLAGKPKQGKSWMALQFGLAVAYGGYALNSRTPVEQGDVLYLALEDTRRRLQQRIGRLMDGVAAPERLHLATKWENFGTGGLADIEEWLGTHQDARLVIVDTFQKVRPARGKTGNDTYGEDYEHSSRLKDVADKYGVAILAIHHTRKATTDHPLEQVSGTNGITGCADAVLVIQREDASDNGTLYVTGRDVRERHYRMHHDVGWTLMEPIEVEERWTPPQLSYEI